MIPARQLFLCMMTILLLSLAGCAATEQTVSANADPTLQKPENQIHGEVNAFYGHSAGN